MSGATEEKLEEVRYAFKGRVVQRNVVIALVVGSLLTLANQFDVLFTKPLTPRLGVKILVNFLIPFIVSSTSAVINRHPGRP